MTRLARCAVALLAVVAVTGGAVTLVRLANGDFAGDYPVTGFFARASEGLHPGSEVAYRGVSVGRVSTISLAGTRARIVLLIDPTFHVPQDATATIEPVNVFGADQVTLTAPAGSASGPYLAPGGTLRHAVAADELGDLLGAATPLLHNLDSGDLSTVVEELAAASQGEGPHIATAIEAGARLASLLDDSLQSQLAALDSFARFTTALAPDGSVLNGLSAQENAALPAFNASVADYQRLIDTLIPFSDRVATLLADYHPDIATLLTQGDDVARVLLAQQANIGQVVHGAYEYALKFGQGGSQAQLPDGSRYAYFNTFILFGDINSMICSLLTPDTPGLSYLEPLQQAVAGPGSAFNCSAQLAAFDAAQTTPAAPASKAATPATAPVPTAPASSAGQAAANQAYGILGQPDHSVTTTVGGYLNQILGGAL